jgi:hypothetical protein
MVDLSQSDIERLISCAKRVTEAPRRELKEEVAYFRNDAKLESADGDKGEFPVFLRKNTAFPENFSIGLVFNPQDGQSSIILLRLNGKHGSFNKSFDPEHPHCAFHVHIATEEAIKARSKPEKHAETTTEFASFEEALQVFVRRINLDAAEATKYFPACKQLLFEF